MQARLTKTMRSPSAIQTAFGDSSKIAWKRWRSVASSSRRSCSLLRSHSSAVKTAAPPSDPAAPVAQEWIPLVANVAAGEPMISPRDEAEDWYSFKDPRQFYYGTYVLNRSKLQDTAEKNFEFVEKHGALASLPKGLTRRIKAILHRRRTAEHGTVRPRRACAGAL